MTRREHYRQKLLWAIHQWMLDHPDVMLRTGWRRRTRFFVFLGIVLFSGHAMAADPVKLVSTESKPQALKAVQQASQEQPQVKPVVKPAKVLKIDYPAMSEEEKKEEGSIKSLKGMVSGVNNFGIAVEYKGDTEMWADFMKDTKVSGFKRYSELKYGDTVEITYKQLKKEPKRFLLKVNLLKRAEPAT